jgi:chromosome partitioning protein
VIIAVANQKGGVAKTTTAVNLAHGAALKGHRVLLVDLDTQGNAADALGIEPGSDLSRWLLLGEDIPAVATRARDNLDLIRSNKQTAVLKMQLAGMDFREAVLANALTWYDRAGYELVILDCPPSTDLLHVAALVASDYVLIPARMEQFAIKGIADLLSSLASVNKATRANCQLAGILPTFFDWSTSESHLQLTNLTQHSNFAPYIWPVIPTDTICRECNREGKTLWEIKPKPAALIGRDFGSKLIGGYQAAMGRLIALL